MQECFERIICGIYACAYHSASTPADRFHKNSLKDQLFPVPTWICVLQNSALVKLRSKVPDHTEYQNMHDEYRGVSTRRFGGEFHLAIRHLKGMICEPHCSEFLSTWKFITYVVIVCKHKQGCKSAPPSRRTLKIFRTNRQVIFLSVIPEIHLPLANCSIWKGIFCKWMQLGSIMEHEGYVSSVRKQFTSHGPQLSWFEGKLPFPDRAIDVGDFTVCFFKHFSDTVDWDRESGLGVLRKLNPTRIRCPCFLPLFLPSFAPSSIVMHHLPCFPNKCCSPVPSQICTSFCAQSCVTADAGCVLSMSPLVLWPKKSFHYMLLGERKTERDCRASAWIVSGRCLVCLRKTCFKESVRLLRG